MPIRSWLTIVHRRDRQPVDRRAQVLRSRPSTGHQAGRRTSAAESSGACAPPCAARSPAPRQSPRWCSPRSSTEQSTVAPHRPAAREPLAFFRYLGDEFRRGLTTGDQLGICFADQNQLPRRLLVDRLLALNCLATSLLASFAAHLIDRHARCHRDQNSPQIVPVANLRKSSLLGVTTESGKRFQRHVFFVGSAAGMDGQLPAGQSHQPLEIAFPQQPRCGVITGFELVELTANRPIIGQPVDRLHHCLHNPNEGINRPNCT